MHGGKGAGSRRHDGKALPLGGQFSLSDNSGSYIAGGTGASTLNCAAITSVICNFVEWFDYAAYGYLATIIAAVFFSKSDTMSGLLAAYVLFAIFLILRSIGGIVWGHFGDRIGRRTALSLSTLIMSSATFLIAFQPTYQQIGLWTPVLLLVICVVQAFSAAGVDAGASAFLAEYGPEGKRDFYPRIVPASTTAGLLFGSLFVGMLHTRMTPDQLQSYGWRLPFLLAAPLGLIIKMSCNQALKQT